MRFISPSYSVLFLLLLFLVCFYAWTQKSKVKALNAFADPVLFRKYTNLRGLRQDRQAMFLKTCGLFFLILALLGPEWGYRWQEVRSRGLEIIIALDTSKSMLATDLRPNRLERAKLAIRDFLKQIPGHQVGLVAFSGTSFLQAPLTMDYNAFQIALDALDVYTLPRGGTAIGKAIDTARAAFQSGGNGHQILILITDGENHEGDPLAQARKAQEEGITVYTIGLGSQEGELIPVRDEKGNTSYLKDGRGHVVKTVLQEEALKEIAKAGGGAYFRGTGPVLGLDLLYQTELAHLEQADLHSSMEKKYINRYQIPLFFALLMLGAEFILVSRKEQAHT
ncbi:MAG TPA: VWA domain-containing protein [Bacillota bacterium]